MYLGNNILQMDSRIWLMNLLYIEVLIEDRADSKKIEEVCKFFRGRQEENKRLKRSFSANRVNR